MDPSVGLTTGSLPNLSFDQILKSLINTVSNSDNQNPKIAENHHHRPYPQYSRPTTSQKRQENDQQFKPNFWPEGDSFKNEQGGGDLNSNFLPKKQIKNRPKTATTPSTSSSSTSRIPEEFIWMKVLEERSRKNESDDKVPKDLQSKSRKRNDCENEMTIVDYCGSSDDDNLSFVSEFPRSIYTAESGCGSDATSIGWADDEIEGESTDILTLQWSQVEQVFRDDSLQKPDGMSESIYQEILLWRRAFNPIKSAFQRNVPQTLDTSLDDIQAPYFDTSPLSSLQVEFDGQDTLLSPSIMTPTLHRWSPQHQERRALQLPSFLQDLSSPQPPNSQVHSWLENQTIPLAVKINQDNNYSGSLEVSPEEEDNDVTLSSLPYINDRVSILKLNNEDSASAPEENELKNNPKSRSKSNWEEDEDIQDFSVIMSSQQQPQPSIKVQRPISSQYLNRSITRAGGSGSSYNPTIFSNSIYKSNNSEERKLSASSRNWSRHGSENNNDLPEFSRKLINKTIKSDKTKHNFMSWLLLDENDENSVGDRDSIGIKVD